MHTRIAQFATLLLLLALAATGCVPIQPEAAGTVPMPTSTPTPVAATSPDTTTGAVARGRVANLVVDAPLLLTYANGNPVGNPFGPGDLTDYLEVPPDTYVIRFAPQGASADAAVAPDLTVTAEAGHDYTIVLLGTVADDNIQVLLVDDTAALSQIDPATQTVVTFVNNIKGTPPLSLAFGGKTVAQGVAYGDYAQAVVPVGPNDSTMIAEADSPDNVVAAPPFFTGFAPNVTWFFGSYGTYPGENRVDYFLFFVPDYSGALATTDGGAIEVGAPVAGEITFGERKQYALTLAEDATLDIMLSADAESALDAYLRVYAADGTLIAENDEISDEDETTDAGLTGLALPAGAHTIEVGSYRDATPGTFTLSVDTATE